LPPHDRGSGLALRWEQAERFLIGAKGFEAGGTAIQDEADADWPL
jgi:hypothetical protein